MNVQFKPREDDEGLKPCQAHLRGEGRGAWIRSLQEWGAKLKLGPHPLHPLKLGFVAACRGLNACAANSQQHPASTDWKMGFTFPCSKSIQAHLLKVWKSCYCISRMWESGSPEQRISSIQSYELRALWKQACLPKKIWSCWQTQAKACFADRLISWLPKERLIHFM